MNKNDYTQKALTHLADRTYYTQINTTQEAITQQTIQKYQDVQKSITHSKLTPQQKQEIIKYTRPNKVRFPKIYFNPKTHKPNLPFRPIVSGIQWATEKCAILLDEQLKKIIYAHTHIPKDTFSVMKLIEHNQYNLLTMNPEQTYLVTFDVEALYTSIPQDQAINRTYSIIQQNSTLIPPNIYRTITQYILKNNYFTHQDKIYHQTHGIAMGNPAGGAIANTYLLTWDNNIINNHAYKNHIHMYMRYHDDGFFIWHGPEETLKQLLTFINTIDPYIKTTHTYGKQLTYLDIEITLTNHNTILTRTHRKATAPETYLKYTSAHPKTLKNNLPFSIFFRSFIIANSQETFNRETKTIIQRFKKSGYSRKTVIASLTKLQAQHNIPTSRNQHAYITARRQALLAVGNKSHTQAQTHRIFMPLTYWPNVPYTHHINKQKWQETLKNCHIKNHHPTIAFKQPPNILRLLTKAST